MPDVTVQHWIVDIARKSALPGAEKLDIPSSASVRDAWTAVCRNCSVSEADLSTRVAARYRLRVANLEQAESRAARLIPEALARKFGVLPLREDDRQIFIATSDPLDFDAEQALGFAAGRTPVMEIAPPSLISEGMEQVYSPERSVEALLGSVDTEGLDEVQFVEEIAPDRVDARELTAKPVVRLTNFVLQQAIHERASDIHIEPGRSGGLVRVRVDGVLRNMILLPMAALNRVVSRIKILGKLDIADRLRPQDGRARIQVRGRTYDLRISTVPARESEKVVIRILDPEGSPPLGSIGMAEYELARLRQLIGFREGVVIVTGPTGSGKTTTMYGAVRELATGKINIMTVEDPVEYELPGITQMQVDPKRGVTFASALRAILRQDPDVVFVGEIRDAETAEIAVQASMTGHLVLATLHTNDAAGAIPRLVDLGLSPVSVAATLRGVVAQRLLRRVCPDCKAPVTGDLTPAEAELAARYGTRPVVRAVGCKKCGATGYRGRVAIAEVMMTTPALADGIARNATPMALTSVATAGGMRPMREVALDMVRQGISTLDEVDRVVGEVTPGAAQQAPAVEQQQQAHVLVCDDDVVVRKLARMLLEKAGMRVSEASDGATALAMLQADGDCSLVILDLEMPELNGMEALKRLRAAPVTAGLPVIVLTGSEHHGDEVQVMDAGADDYIRKPIDPPRFISRIKAVLRRAAG